MRKTRRSSKPNDGVVEPVVAESVGTKEVPRDEASATLVIKGSTKQVRDNLSPPDGTIAVEGPDEGPVPFGDAIKNPENTVVVSRIAPRKQDGVKLNIEVYKEKCPLTLSSIEETVFSECGGKRFRVAVLNPDEETIAAKVIEADIDPIIPAQPQPEGQRQPGQVLAGAEPPDPQEQVINQLEIQHEVTRRQVAIEQMRQQLREMKNGGQQGDPRLSGLEENLRELQRQIAEQTTRSIYESKIAALERKLDDVASARNAPKQDSSITILLQQMQKAQEASDKRFEALMAKMDNDKMNAMLDELKAIKTAKTSQKSDLTESIEQVRALADMMGWEMPGGHGDDDDGPDDREWWQILMEDHIPKLIGLFEDKKKAGENLTKEQLLAEIDRAAGKVTAEVRARQAGRLPAPSVPQLPAPPAAAAPPPVAPTGPPPVVEPSGPPPLSDGAITVDLAPPGSSQLATRPPTVEEDIRIRVSSSFDCLAHESQIRPREYEWSVYAWRNLPTKDGGVLDKLAHAPDAAAAIQAFVPYVAPEKAKAMADLLSTDTKLAPWIQLGLDDLSEWWGELAKDPNFDPESAEPEPPEKTTDGGAQ